MYKIGTTEITVFITTLIAVLATDLIIGIAAGILCNYLLIILGKVRPSDLFKTHISIDVEQNNLLQLEGAYTFSNFLGLKKHIDNTLDDGETVILDFAQTTFIDHTTIAHLQALQRATTVDGKSLEFVGLEELIPATSHSQSQRRRLHE